MAKKPPKPRRESKAPRRDPPAARAQLASRLPARRQLREEEPASGLAAARKKLSRFKPTLEDIVGFGVRFHRHLRHPEPLPRQTQPQELVFKLHSLMTTLTEGGLPRQLRFILVGAFAYFIAVPDLLPDFGPLGWADDLVVIRVAYDAVARWRAGTLWGFGTQDSLSHERSP